MPRVESDLVGLRQPKNETCALRVSFVQDDFTAVLFDNPPGLRQAKTQAPARFAAAEKGIKQMLADTSVYTDTVILNAQ